MFGKRQFTGEGSRMPRVSKELHGEERKAHLIREIDECIMMLQRLRDTPGVCGISLVVCVEGNHDGKFGVAFETRQSTNAEDAITIAEIHAERATQAGAYLKGQAKEKRQHVGK